MIRRGGWGERERKKEGKREGQGEGRGGEGGNEKREVTKKKILKIHFPCPRMHAISERKTAQNRHSQDMRRYMRSRPTSKEMIMLDISDCDLPVAPGCDGHGNFGPLCWESGIITGFPCSARSRSEYGVYAFPTSRKPGTDQNMAYMLYLLPGSQKQIRIWRICFPYFREFCLCGVCAHLVHSSSLSPNPPRALQ